MDVGDLRRLARDGIAAFPPSRLRTAVEWLFDYAEASPRRRPHGGGGLARAPSLEALEAAARLLGAAASALQQRGPREA